MSTNFRIPVAMLSLLTFGKMPAMMAMTRLPTLVVVSHQLSPSETKPASRYGTVNADYASKKFCLLLMVNTDTSLSQLEGRIMVQLLIKYLNPKSDAHRAEF
jgi:hypothetical protein